MIPAIIYHSCALQERFLLEKIAQGVFLLGNTSVCVFSIFSFRNSEVTFSETFFPLIIPLTCDGIQVQGVCGNTGSCISVPALPF